MTLFSSHRGTCQVLHLSGRDWELLLGPENAGTHHATLGFSTFPAGSHPAGHTHPLEEELIYVVSGHGQLVTGDQVIDLSPGTAVYIHPGVEHATVAGPDSMLELVTVFAPPVVPGSYEPAGPEATE